MVLDRFAAEEGDTTMRAFGSRRWRAFAALTVAASAVALTLGAGAANAAPTPDRTASTNGRVDDIVQAGGRLYIAGSFTQVTTLSGTAVDRPYLAALDASTGDLDPTFNPAPNGAVTALAADATHLYAAGSFSSVGGLARLGLAAVDLATGVVDPGWRADVSGGGGRVLALAVYGWRLMVGGNFSRVTDAAGAHTRSRFAAVTAKTGTVSTVWKPSLDGTVRALAVSGTGSRLFVGGSFLTAGGKAHSRLASLVTASGGTVDHAFVGRASGDVLGLATITGRLFAAVGGVGGRCTGYSSTNGAQAWSAYANGNVQAVIHLDGLVYCGGHFNGAGAFAGAVRYKLAAVNASTGAVNAFAPVFNSPLGVWSLAGDPGSARLWAGGDFTTVSGEDQQHLAQFTR